MGHILTTLSLNILQHLTVTKITGTVQLPKQDFAKKTCKMDSRINAPTDTR